MLLQVFCGMAQKLRGKPHKQKAADFTELFLLISCSTCFHCLRSIKLEEVESFKVFIVICEILCIATSLRL